MRTLDWVLTGVGASGILGLLFGVRCYVELWRWARQCQHARILIAWKRRVVLDRPLVDYLTWANSLDRDKKANGQVIWRMGQASVAIAKPGAVPSRLRQAIRNVRRRATQPPKTGRAELQ
jgi:hypothetical protein